MRTLDMNEVISDRETQVKCIKEEARREKLEEVDNVCMQGVGRVA